MMINYNHDIFIVKATNVNQKWCYSGGQLAEQKWCHQWRANTPGMLPRQKDNKALKLAKADAKALLTF